eukprot:scaffold81716_cov48-Phaeocystis_antarctica.AAC.1
MALGFSTEKTSTDRAAERVAARAALSAGAPSLCAESGGALGCQTERGDKQPPTEQQLAYEAKQAAAAAAAAAAEEAATQHPALEAQAKPSGATLSFAQLRAAQTAVPADAMPADTVPATATPTSSTKPTKGIVTLSEL